MDDLKVPTQGERRRSSVQSIRHDPDSELSEPYEGAKLSNAMHPFPEAVVSKPYIAARRQPGTFDNDSEGSLETFYQPIEQYEGRHRYDPYFEWEPQQEKKLVRKLDWKICTWCCLMFFALQLDRGNIVQALSDNMLEDIGIDSNNYNYGQMIFYLSFLCAELPSQLISKKYICLIALNMLETNHHAGSVPITGFLFRWCRGV